MALATFSSGIMDLEVSSGKSVRLKSSALRMRSYMGDCQIFTVSGKFEYIILTIFTISYEDKLADLLFLYTVNVSNSVIYCTQIYFHTNAKFHL